MAVNKYSENQGKKYTHAWIFPMTPSQFVVPWLSLVNCAEENAKDFLHR